MANATKQTRTRTNGDLRTATLKHLRRDLAGALREVTDAIAEVEIGLSNERRIRSSMDALIEYASAARDRIGGAK